MMKRCWFLYFLIALFFLSSGSFSLCRAGPEASPAVSGSTSQTNNDVFVDTVNEIRSKSPGAKGAKGSADPLMPVIPIEQKQLDAKTRDKYFETLRAYYEYHLQGYSQRQKVFEWQQLSSQIIFIFVLLLVFIGVGFAAIQFYVGIPRTKTKTLAAHESVASKASEEVEKGQLKDVSQIEISLQGVKVSSPILGVVILIISLAFFYLYLVYVYPVHNTF